MALSCPVQAADCAGRWLVQAGTTPLMAFEVEQTTEGWTAYWERPQRFKSDGKRFFDVSGPVVTDKTQEVNLNGDTCELNFNHGETRFVLHVLSVDQAELSHPAFGKTPAVLRRALDSASLGPWDPNEVYERAIFRPTNSEMAVIFEADQAARRREPGREIDWMAVQLSDRDRRQRVDELLEAGQLSSGEDYYRAAFIFQHGDQASDYLKAHALAIAAMARGNSRADWIAAATLDRYLQAIGQPQVYGTQFSHREGHWTQEPYERELLTDAVREANSVPDLVAQQKQVHENEARDAE